MLDNEMLVLNFHFHFLHGIEMRLRAKDEMKGKIVRTIVEKMRNKIMRFH